MKIGVIQTNIVWCNPAANIARAEELIAASETADLYILPEMWSTGFVIEGQRVAESEESCTALQWMILTARTRDCAISGSLVIKEQGKFFNRHYFITPDGIAARYDKHHLFRLGGETKRFTAGDKRVIVEWKGVRFLLQTCYDIRFPVFARNRLIEGRYEYDAIIYVASFPTARAEVWHTLSLARAIENESFVVAVNRTGDDIYCNYSGGSLLVDSFGGIITQCGSSEEIKVAEIDIEELKSRRKRFPTLRDGDLFELQ
ncbi:MAG: nitrilase family protein [Alistipes sp.]|nr:nitrilase family protein [Alistipes sp.]